ncbi:MAG: aldolase catalytic domain-containing protein [Polyangiaceae bacterium]|nr:aldolase catalytic domain-containing protein [Polyangiaceae bacterium]
MTAPWVTYRPEIQVLDATIRDGGLINDHMFEDGFVAAVHGACIEAGVDTMEIGYKASKKVFAPDKHGAWKFCTEDDLRRVLGDNDSELKIAVMADAGKSDWRTDILPKERSIIDIVRVACYIHQIPEAVDMIKDAHDKGYEATCNLMAVSAVREDELDQALEVIREAPCSTVVVVDSFGSLYGEQIKNLVLRYKKALEGTGKEVGIHAHNNQQLAFANSIEAIIHGANRIDATMGGMGRGAGNCAMELLLGFLRNPKFKLRPIYQLLQEHIAPMREKVEWGALSAYIITGQLNQHPRTAIAWRATPERENCLDFYDRVTSDV